MTALRIATRGSDLALWQARYVAARVEAELGRATELVPIQTTGDRRQDVSLAKIGGKGLFVKEIEEALLDGRADIAVHSGKDLPAESPAELVFAAFPERADARDALVLREGSGGLERLATGARVGTGSVRRTAQLLHARPDLEIVPLRGNVPTRLTRLESDALDAIVLACAGLDRLGMGERISERLDPEVMLPSVAQGALVVQTRRGDRLESELSALDHAETATRVAAERAFQARLGGDCSVPLAGYAELAGGRLRLRTCLLSTDGTQRLAESGEAPREDAVALGQSLGDALLRAGGDALLASSRPAAAS